MRLPHKACALQPAVAGATQAQYRARFEYPPTRSFPFVQIEERMMKSRLMIVVAGFVALTSVTSYAQSASPDAQTAAPSRSAKKAERLENRAFAKKVRQAIVKAHGIGNAQVTVFAKAKTGEVTLAGLITDESQDKAAVEAARQVPGVTSVTSKLQLRMEGGQ
ncbi:MULTISPECIES: BON domain-containing protein [Burkholderia]|uniref:BON domain-containing protein n=1 Tax=Burkholderia TaxID=32008 RepID=UPI001E4D391D|nr:MULTISPECIES: BON domain-containing protein [Burkholderia]